MDHVLRDWIRPKNKLGHNAELPTARAADRPEEILVLLVVDHETTSFARDDSGLVEIV